MKKRIIWGVVALIAALIGIRRFTKPGESPPSFVPVPDEPIPKTPVRNGAASATMGPQQGMSAMKRRIVIWGVAVVVLMASIGLAKLGSPATLVPTLDEPIAYVATFSEDGTETVGAWDQATCNDNLGPIVRTTGEVEYMPDKYSPPNEPLNFSVKAKFGKDGKANKVTFSTPNKEIDQIIPLNVVNRDASPQAIWAKSFYSPATRTDTVAIVPAKGEGGFYSGDYWMICLMF